MRTGAGGDLGPWHSPAPLDPGRPGPQQSLRQVTVDLGSEPSRAIRSAALHSAFEKRGRHSSRWCSLSAPPPGVGQPWHFQDPSCQLQEQSHRGGGQKLPPSLKVEVVGVGAGWRQVSSGPSLPGFPPSSALHPVGTSPQPTLPPRKGAGLRSQGQQEETGDGKLLPGRRGWALGVQRRR